MKKPHDLKFWILMLAVMLIITQCTGLGRAKAEDVVLNYTLPTEQETCTNAGATTVDGVNIWQLVDTIPAPLETYTIPAMKPGSYTYAATAFNADGESRLSGKTTKEVTEWVTVDTQAKIVAKINGDFLLLTVGTVPLGTACNPDINVKGHYAIDPDAVTYSGARDVIVVAQCG